MHKTSQALLIGALLILSACAPAATAVPTEVAATQAPTSAAPAVTQEPVHLKVGLLNFMSHAPLFIAQEAGYFAAQGLDVELTTFGSSEAEMMTGIIQGQLDVAATTLRASTVNGINQGSGIQVVADKAFFDPDASCASDAIMVRKDMLESGTLDDLQNLKGLTVTMGTGTISQLVMERLLAEGGLTAADIVDVQLDFSSRGEALRTGALDVATISEPWITRTRDSGAGEVWRAYADLLPGFSSGVIMYGPSMLSRDPDVGVRFLLAYLQGVQQFAQGATDENVRIIAGFTKLEPEEIKRMCWPSFRANGQMDTATLMEFEEWASGTGLLDAVLPVEQIYYPSFVEQAYARLGK